MFAADFSWTNSSYSLEQDYDATSFQVEEDAQSDNPVSEDEAIESDAAEAPSSAVSGFSGNSPSLGTTVASEEEVVIGSGGTTVGGTPSEGEGSSGGGGTKPIPDPEPGTDPEPGPDPGWEIPPDDPTWEPDRIGDPNRFEDVQNPYTDTIGSEERDSLVRVVVEGRGKVLVGQPMDLESFVRPYVTGYIEVRRAATGKVERLDLNKSQLRVFSYTEPQVGAKQTSVRLSFIDAAYGQSIVEVPCDVYEHCALFEGMPNGAQDIALFFNGSTLEASDEAWQTMLSALPVNAQGDLEQLFCGWSSPDVSGLSLVDSATVPDDRRIITLQPLPAFDLASEGFGHLVVRAEGNEQVLVGVRDRDALANDLFRVPEGVNAVRFEADAAPFNGIRFIELSSTVRSVDIARAAAAFPDLETWFVASGNPVYAATNDGYLVKRLFTEADYALVDDAVTLESVPPATNVMGGLWIEENVVGFGSDAFAGLSSDDDLELCFMSDEVVFSDWQSIPLGAVVSPPLNTPYDIAYCRYLSAVALNRSDLQVSKPRTGLVRWNGAYEADEEGFVRFEPSAGGKLLAYAPLGSCSSFEMPDDITGMCSTAFEDCDSLSTLVLAPRMSDFEEGSLVISGMSTLIVPKPEGIDFGANASAFGMRSAYPEGFKVLLSCEKGSDAYKRFHDALMAAWGNEQQVQKALVCLGDGSGTVEVDELSGATYLRDGEHLTLCSVPSSATEVSVREDTTDVMAGAFDSCAHLKIACLPPSVKSVGAQAFAGCSSLEALLYPEAALQGASLEQWASSVGLTQASGCSSLVLMESSSDYASDAIKAVYRKEEKGFELVYVVSDAAGKLELLPGTIRIADGAAKGRTGLEAVSGLQQVGSIGAQAFMGCSSLETLEGLSAVQSLGDESFADCGLKGTLVVTGSGLECGRNAFARCSNLREVLFRGQITSLGTGTFTGCDYLQRVELGDALSTIATTGESTFAGCAQLNQVVVGGAVEAIGPASFANCPSLITVSFQQPCWGTLCSIGDEAFLNCVSLNGFSLSRLSALESLGARALCVEEAVPPGDGASLLTSRLTLPTSLESIGPSAFSGQSALQTISIVGSDAKLRLIGEQAFTRCSSLRQVVLGAVTNPLVIGEGAFEGCAALQSVTAPKSMTSVERGAFKGCASLASFTLQGSGASAWVNVGAEAFSGCIGLTSFDLSATQVTTLGDGAFEDCANLALVTLPRTVEHIGERTFARCQALVALSLLSEMPPAVGASAFNGCAIEGLTVQVPQSAADAVLVAYRASASWRQALADSAGEFEEQRITAGDNKTLSFEGADYLRTENGLALVKVHDSQVTETFAPLSQTTRVEAGAFQGCASIATVKIPASVKHIAAGAFEGCDNLQMLVFEADRPPEFAGRLFGSTTVPEGFKLYVPTGGTNWYGSLPSLERYRIVTGGARFALQQDGLLFTSYDASASTPALDVLFKVPSSFTGTINLTSATDYIADGACEGCTGLTEVYLNGYVSTVGRRAFKDCTALVHADLGPSSNNLVGLGESAFEGCSSLQTLSTSSGRRVPTIPSTVTTLGVRTFKDCTSLPYLSLQGPVKHVPEGLLEGCTSLGYLTAGSTAIENLQSFGAHCFKGCTSMTTAGASLTSFSNLESIGAGAYEGCTQLSLITLPASLSSIGQEAFAGCSNVDAIAFNATTPLQLDGTGLDRLLGQARVFVPLGTKAAWQQSFGTSPLVLDDVSATYRAISGNIYAETRYVSATEGDLTFLATTKQASATGTVTLYQGTNLHVTAVGSQALAGVRNVNSFAARSWCTSLGDRAFDGTGNGAFTLDLSESRAVPQVGTKLFGDDVSAGGGVRVVVPSTSAQSFIDGLSPQFRKDYGLELRVESTAGTKATLSFVAAVSTAEEASAQVDASDGALAAEGIIAASNEGDARVATEATGPDAEDVDGGLVEPKYGGDSALVLPIGDNGESDLEGDADVGEASTTARASTFTRLKD